MAMEWRLLQQNEEKEKKAIKDKYKEQRAQLEEKHRNKLKEFAMQEAMRIQEEEKRRYEDEMRHASMMRRQEEERRRAEHMAMQGRRRSMPPMLGGGGPRPPPPHPTGPPRPHSPGPYAKPPYPDSQQAYHNYGDHRSRSPPPPEYARNMSLEGPPPPMGDRGYMGGEYEEMRDRFPHEGARRSPMMSPRRGMGMEPGSMDRAGMERMERGAMMDRGPMMERGPMGHDRPGMGYDGGRRDIPPARAGPYDDYGNAPLRGHGPMPHRRGELRPNPYSKSTRPGARR
eukprot:g10569.t1